MFTARVGAFYRVVIPPAVRRLLNLKQGDAVTLSITVPEALDKGEVV